MTVDPIAVLPMYDRPEIRTETDRLWALIRDRLRDGGVNAPEALDRTTPRAEAWLSPDLVLGQTCGLPFATRLAGRVALVGAPDYAVDGCPPGHYASALVVRSDDPRTELAAFAGATVALNERGSQSGHGALLAAVAPFARAGRFFGAVRLTGSHAGSIAAVARGEADIAAIDAVTWRLARRHEPAAAALRPLAFTEPTPGLPFVTARSNDPATVAAACEDAIAALDAGARDALGLRGFIRFTDADYAPLASRLAAAEARVALPD